MATSLNYERHLTTQEDVLVLADDSENEVFDKLHSKLSLEIKEQVDIEQNVITTPTTVPFEGSLTGTDQISFEVVSAETVKDGRKHYVLYTILVSGHQKIDKNPSTVKKRYSDLEKLNTQLKQKFPDLMEDVSFPEKLLVGNFKNETIAKRSRAFEQYLTHIFSVISIRFSKEFREFFYEKEIRNAYALIEKEKYSDAITVLEECLPIQEKLQGNWHLDVINTLCALALCYRGLESRHTAIKYIESALSCLKGNEENEIYLPLVNEAVYLYWMTGKDKTHLEAKLVELKQKGVKIEDDPGLLSVVLQRFRK